MKYQEQLLQTEWHEKRKIILKRDTNKCLECHNSSYQNSFRYGLVIGNNIIGDFPKINFHKGKYIFNIWDIKLNTVISTIFDLQNFITDKSYVAFYEKNKFINVIALKKFDDKQLVLSNNLFDIVSHGIKGKFTEETCDFITSPISKYDTWDFIKGLHIHHTHYQQGKLAWEYDSSALQTLCWVCHENLHKYSKIDVLDFNGNLIGEYTNCEKCSGAGYLPEFYHVQSGICFRCGGKRFNELI